MWKLSTLKNISGKWADQTEREALEHAQKTGAIAFDWGSTIELVPDECKYIAVDGGRAFFLQEGQKRKRDSLRG